MTKFKAAIDSHKFAAQIERIPSRAARWACRARRPASSTATSSTAPAVPMPSRRSPNDELAKGGKGKKKVAAAIK